MREQTFEMSTIIEEIEAQLFPDKVPLAKEPPPGPFNSFSFDEFLESDLSQAFTPPPPSSNLTPISEIERLIFDEPEKKEPQVKGLGQPESLPVDKKRMGLTERTVKQFLNNLILEDITEIGAEFQKGEIKSQVLGLSETIAGEFKGKKPEDLSFFDKAKVAARIPFALFKEFNFPSRISENRAVGRGIARLKGERPREFDVPAPENVPEKIANVGAGLSAFLTRVYTVRGIVPKGLGGLREILAWEIQNTQGPPGSGAAMAGTLKALSKVREVGLLGKNQVGALSAQVGIESGLFASIAAVQGAELEDIIISSLIPVAIRTPAFLKAVKNSLNKAITVQQKTDVINETASDVEKIRAFKKENGVIPDWALKKYAGVEAKAEAKPEPVEPVAKPKAVVVPTAPKKIVVSPTPKPAPIKRPAADKMVAPRAKVPVVQAIEIKPQNKAGRVEATLRVTLPDTKKIADRKSSALKQFDELYKQLPKDKPIELTILYKDAQIKATVDTKDELVKGRKRTTTGQREQRNIREIVGQFVSVPQGKKKLVLRPPTAPKPSKVTAVKDLDLTKAAKLLGTLSLKDTEFNQKYALTEIQADKNRLVVTDGRRAFILNRPDLTKGLKFRQKTGDVLLSKSGITVTGEGKFPDLDKIIPENNLIATENTQDMIVRLRQTAKAMKGAENQYVALFVNPNKSIGFIGYSPEVGSSQINIQTGAKLIREVNMGFLRDTLELHAKLGSERLDLHGKADAEQPFKMVGRNKDVSVIMPGKGRTFGEPPSAISKEEFKKPSVQQVQNEKYVRASGKMLVPLQKEDLHALVQFPGTLARKVAESPFGPAPDRMVAVASGSESSKRFADSFFQIADRTAALEGYWLNEFFEGMDYKGKKLSKEKFDEFIFHVRELRESDDPHIVSAAENVWKVGELIRLIAEPHNIPVYSVGGETTFKGRRRYFPVMLSKETQEQIDRRNGPLYVQAVEHIVDHLNNGNLRYYTSSRRIQPRTKKQTDKVTRTQAKNWLRDMREHDPAYWQLNKLLGGLTGKSPQTKAGGRFYGSAQRHRLFDWPVELGPKDPHKIMEHHIRRFARLIAETEYWGLPSATPGKPTDQTGILRQWIKQADKDIMKAELDAGRDPQIARTKFAQMASSLIGYESNIPELQANSAPQWKTTLRTARTVASGTFLFGVEAPVRNAIWGTSSAIVRFGPLRVARAWPELIFRGPTMVREARKAGALAHPYMQDLFAESAIPERANNILRAPMFGAEVLLRSASARLGVQAWGGQVLGNRHRLVRKGKNPSEIVASDISKSLMRVLTHREVGFKESQVVDMVRRGKLTAEETERMMRGAVNLTQFQAGARNLQHFMGTEVGRAVFQFWGMAYQQTMKTIGYSMIEAGHRNYIPMFRLLMGMAFAGVSIKAMRDFLSGKTPTKRDLDTTEQAVRFIGDGLGVLGKPVTLFTATRSEELIRQVTPPSLSLVADTTMRFIDAVRKSLPREGFEAEKKEKASDAWRRLLSIQSSARSIDKLYRQYEQGRGPGQQKFKIPYDMDKVAQWYRGKLANEYRKLSDPAAIRKVNRFVGNKISRESERKKALATVRGEFYDRGHFAQKRRDIKEYNKLRRYYLNFLDGKGDIWEDAMVSRRFKEVDEKPPKSPRKPTSTGSGRVGTRSGRIRRQGTR